MVAEAVMNKDLPKAIDEYTTLEHIGGNSQRYVYSYSLSDKIPSDADVQIIKTSNISQICATYGSQLKSARLQALEYRYRFSDGKTDTFFVYASDC
jgi:hypothetical protein